jgi:hypothetical protein
MKLVVTIFAVFFFFQCAELMHISHDGLYAWHTFDEATTGNKCQHNNECDGQRTCSVKGLCRGAPRPAKSVHYHYNEAITGGRCDEHSKNGDYYCDGNRTCNAAGWCQGFSR